MVAFQAGKISRSGAVFAAERDIFAVYLIGSQQELGWKYLCGVKFEPIEGADLDVGVLLRNWDPMQDAFSQYGRFSLLIDALFEQFHIDLVILNEAPTLVAAEAISGIAIHRRSEDMEEIDQWENMILAKTPDLRYMARKSLDDFLKAAQDGYRSVEL